MTIVDKSRSPYFDDYNADKGFQEVLFVPSRAVQVRELNQIQSMFYEQINRFGDHVFEDGSVVIPGESNYDLELKYAKTTIDNFANVVQFLSGSNLSLVGTSGITANVKLFREPDGTDPSTFFLEYIQPSTDGLESTFADAEVVTVFNGTTELTTAIITETGLGSKFTIDSGVYYIKGRFVLVEQQTVILDKYSSTPSKSVCIEYNEVIVTENDDNSLFDNAQGTTNFTAPGAHRLKIDTNLVVVDLADLPTIPSNYVEIFRVDAGDVQKTYRGPDYNVLGDVLAQRTYEESGDYTVKSYKIGFDTHNELFGSVDTTKFGIELDPGIAYVRGYRVETNSKTKIVADKARDTGVINNSSISGGLGYYVEVENLSALPSITALQSVNFKDSGGSIIGTARIRFISETTSGVFRLYLFNVKNVSGLRTTSFVSSATVIDSTDTVTFTSDIIDAVIKEASFNSLVFPMNVEFVKTLNVNSGFSDTSYASVKQLTNTTDTSGQVTFSANSNEIFVSQDSRYAIGYYTDTNESFDVASNVTLSGTPTGSVITISLGVGNASRAIRVNLQVAKQEVIQKIKSKQTISITGSLTSGVLPLGKADAYNIVSVVDNESNNITSLFTLSNNKTQSFYDISTISTSSTVSEPITVTFDFFSHGSGDYFGPDSYVDIDYEDIQTENGTRLSDVLDFRPRINDAGTGFTGTGSSVGNIPTPFTIIRADLEHYLKRIDKVYLNASGLFGVKRGIPSIDPSSPSDPSEAMILYTIYIPPYTFNISDVQAEKVNNRRYTMSDIGDIETRLSNVEYYVSLTLLEQEADATQVADPVTGANRFKNGFLTDRFIDHGVADFSWEGYHVAISDEDGELRPEFSLNAIDLQYVSSESSNVVINSDIITLPFDHVSYVRQNQSSETMNVNPYAIYRWTGTLKLTPSMDSWIDTHYKSPEVTYRIFNNGQLTQSWKSWQLNWTGASTTQNRDFSRNSAPHSVWQDPNAIGEGVWNRGLLRRTTDTFRTTTTNRTNIDIVNDRVLDTSVVPFMRSIDIDLTGKGNRPNSIMYFFFDETSIDSYVKPDGGNFGDPVFADVNGAFNAIFRIPNNDEQSFRTGEKTIIATDEVNNQQQLSTSYAQSLFTATGTRQIRRQTITATRSITSNTRLTRRVWSDPLAQSFLVERNGGMFVTKINTFFSTKDDNVPVAVQIREMENGFPTQRLVPGGEKLLLPSEVTTTNDATTPTTFEFDHPVYLEDGNEYCFVLMSNSNAYNAYIGRMGKQDLQTNQFIVRQPYAGVLFKSQNNSTWTEDQQADLQFEIFVAKFDTSVTGIVVTENKDLDMIRLSGNPIATEIGSSDVIIYRENHNYVQGTNLSISGSTGANNITATEINDSHTVVEVIDPNRIKITLTSVADTSGDIGGLVVEISDTIQASLINPNIPVIDLTDTNVAFFAKGTTGKSINGSETPYAVQSLYSAVDNETINQLSFPLLITNRNDEVANTSNQRTFKMLMELTSTNENVSPVIDMSGATVITPFSQVTYNQTTVTDGSNNWANYRTRVNPLSSPSDMFKIFLDIKSVNSANVIISARVSNSEEELQDSDWVEIPNTTVDTPSDGNNFYEYQFEKTGFSEFSFYQVMIQLKSQSSVFYPSCKRLRVIALSDFS
jgi:hypothetical protein